MTIAILTSPLDEAFALLTTLGLHVPNFILRDVQSKFVILDTSSRVVTGPKDGPKIPHKRITRLYQCSCGLDNTEGRLAGKTRENPWKNVSCSCWARVVITVDDRIPNSMS